MLGSLIAVGAFVFVLYRIFMIRNRKDFPQGPYGLPILGYLPFVGKNPPKTAFELSKKYGPVFSVNIGTQTYIVLNDFDSIHEAFVKNGHVFSGRISTSLPRPIKGLGILNADYADHWRIQRKFGMRTLKGLGVGKRSLEEKILQEVHVLCESIRVKEGQSFNCLDVIESAAANVICSIILGSRMTYDNPRFTRILDNLHEGIAPKMDIPFLLIMLYAPFLRYLPVFSAVTRRQMEKQKEVEEAIMTVITDQKKTFDENNSQDFLDEYLKEMNKSEEERHHSFHEMQLIRYIWDLLVGGTDTTSSTLLWAFLCFAHYPQYEDKLYEEVNAVLGDSGNPSMELKSKMPQTLAFIQEIMRHRTLAVFTMVHKVTDTVNFRGFTLPKNTPVLANLWAVHNDPKHFQEPEEFNPQRFINEAGDFVPDEHIVPFSLGPRHCMGESLAKMELFLILTRMVQEFKIVPDPQKPLPPFEKGIMGHFVKPPVFEISFIPR